MAKSVGNFTAVCCSWKTTSHSWKSSAKLLVVGHQNGTVSIIEIEKAAVVHSLSLGSEIKSLDWIHVDLNEKPGSSVDAHTEYLPHIHKEELATYLSQGETMTSDHGHQCFLIVTTANGNLHLYLDGIFKVLEMSLEKYPIQFESHKVVACHFSPKTALLTLVSKSKTSDGETDSFYLHRFHCPHLLSRSQELCLLSRAYTQLHYLLKRSDKVLKQMSDSSEDISLKINTKLDKLEKLVSPAESSVAAEFTIAYATGETSPELETFLTQNLTSKGLKQIEQSVQLAYASMHSDITEEMELLIQHSMVYLLQIYGMSKWTEHFQEIGLNEKSVISCLSKLGTFAMRVLKLLEVICSDMEDFSIFFTWLTCLCFQVSNEMSANYPQLSFKEFDVMVDFLENRLQKTSQGTFNLERISHFFNDEIAKTSTLFNDVDQNIWYEYINTKECLKDHPFVLVPDHRASLVSQFKDLESSFDAIFTDTVTALSASVSLTSSIKLFAAADGHDENCSPVISYLDREDRLLASILACSCDSDRMFLLELTSNPEDVNIAGLCIEAPKLEEMDESNAGDLPQYTMRYSTFYGNETMTILHETSEPESDNQPISVLSQLPLDDTIEKLTFTKCSKLSNVEGLLDSEDLDVQWLNVKDEFTESRTLDNFHAASVSVNEGRSVSCVIASNGRRVRIFEMESCEDEPEDEEGESIVEHGEGEE
eukprot:TCONS_00025908-protein